MPSISQRHLMVHPFKTHQSISFLEISTITWIIYIAYYSFSFPTSSCPLFSLIAPKLLPTMYFSLPPNAWSLKINFNIPLSDYHFLSSPPLSLEPPFHQFSNLNEDSNPWVLLHDQALYHIFMWSPWFTTIKLSCLCHPFRRPSPQWFTFIANLRILTKPKSPCPLYLHLSS